MATGVNTCHVQDVTCGISLQERWDSSLEKLTSALPFTHQVILFSTALPIWFILCCGCSLVCDCSKDSPGIDAASDSQGWAKPVSALPSSLLFWWLISLLVWGLVVLVGCWFFFNYFDLFGGAGFGLLFLWFVLFCVFSLGEWEDLASEALTEMIVINITFESPFH